MLRADLANIPAYVPGKRMPGALKLSSNEITEQPLASAVEAMAQAAADVNRYPDPAATELREELAEHLQLPMEQITLGCGSSALCQSLAQVTCLPGDEMVFPWRSFEGYPIYAAVVGATPVAVPLTAEHGNDLDAMAAAVTERTKLIFVCNPNNPTGTTISEAEFVAFMERVPSTIVVALDEAYFEYNRDENSPNAAELVRRYDNLIGLRTFSKAFGLAGVRVGYAFGNTEIIEALNKVTPVFSVNSVAQAGAIASLRAADELMERTDTVVAQRERVAKALGGVPSQANFVWVPGATAASALAEAGVLVRAFEEGIRVTITNEQEMDRLLNSWPAP